MELKLYLRILMRKWWIVLAATLFTLLITFFFVSRQPSVYEAKTTFVIRPRSSFSANAEEFVKAVDTLSRRIEINSTYAEVADSDLIKERAIESLGLTDDQRKGLKASGKLVAGTNVLEITGQGPNPVIVRAFTDAISRETAVYVSNLYEVFELELLDAAQIPKKPVGPNRTLNLAIGAMLGLLLGVGLIFLLEYLKEPLEGDSNFNIVDPETGVYNKSYFMLRLHQELARSRNSTAPFSVALIKAGQYSLIKGFSQPTIKILRELAADLQANVRDEDVLAYVGQDTFGLLLPGISRHGAQSGLEILRVKAGLPSADDIGRSRGITIYGLTGITTVTNDAVISENDVLAQAAEALKESEKTISSKKNLLTGDLTEQFAK